MDEIAPTEFCHECGGEMTPLGWLGTMLWYRCRCCGAEAGLGKQAVERKLAEEREADSE